MNSGMKDIKKILEEELASWFYGVRTWGLLNGLTNEEFCKKEAHGAAETILQKIAIESVEAKVIKKGSDNRPVFLANEEADLEVGDRAILLIVKK